MKNLLSPGIIAAAGTPGPNAAKALQQLATDTTKYHIDPPVTRALFGALVAAVRVAGRRPVWSAPPVQVGAALSTKNTEPAPDRR